MDMQRELWKKYAILLLSALLIQTGCEKREVVENTNVPVELARGHSLPGLVFAANAPVFDPGRDSYLEAVRSEGVWHFHFQGEMRGPCRSEDEIHQSISEFRIKQGDPRIVISAECDTPFAEIRTMVRGAARAGFGRVDFLVFSASERCRNQTFSLELPAVDGSGQPDDIEPLLVSVDDNGQIYIGRGPSRVLQDSDPEDHALPKLANTLELLSTAARAAQCQPFCMLHLNSAASYQRLIDVLSRFHEYQITRIWFTDFVYGHDTTCNGMNFDRIERMELLKSKPRPMPPSSHPRLSDR
jgi:biopolymer transport protein ExbD